MNIKLLNILLGISLHYLKRYLLALDCFDKALKINAQEIKIFVNKGN